MRQCLQRLLFRFRHRAALERAALGATDGTLLVRVAGIRQEARNIMSFELAALPGNLLPAFLPGASLGIHLDGRYARYPLCHGFWQSGRYLIAADYSGRNAGLGRDMRALLRIGDVLMVDAPRSDIVLQPSARLSLLLADADGIGPVLAIAHALAASGQAFELHYRGRSFERMAFLSALDCTALAGRTTVHCSDGPGRQLLDLDLALARPSAGKHLYVYGAPSFVATVTAAASAQGWRDSAVHCQQLDGTTASPIKPDRAIDPALAELMAEGVIIPVERPGAR